MKKALQETQKTFESASNRTPEYLSWHRLFKREFKKFLTNKGATQIEIGKPNHFDMSGFFTLTGQIWYFSVSDIRWSKESMLIRTAKSYKDYTGGMNQFISLQGGEEKFNQYFEDIMNRPFGLKPITHQLPLVDQINQAQVDCVTSVS